jgi:chaperonin GroEL
MSTTPKDIIFEEEARQKLLSGIKQLAQVVSFTLGPKGRNVGLEKSWGAPTITNDGSSIVRDFELKDSFENMGVQIAKEVVQKIKEKCGDGTTTTALLLASLLENGCRFISSGASPIKLKRGMDKAVEAVIKEIEKNAIPIKDNSEVRNIAMASSSFSDEIGDMIAEAVEKVGRNGVITIEEAKGTNTTIEIVEGMQFDRGYLSSYFCTNPEKMTVEMQNAYIMLVDKKISSVHEILPILQATAASGRELLIIAEDIDGDALATLVVNKLRGTLKVCAVKAPGFGDRRKAMMEDIAILTGGTLITDEMGVPLKDATIDHLGVGDKIITTKEHTTIVSNKGDKKAIQARLNQIDAEIKNSTSSYEKEKLEERKAKLSGGIAVIRVGAATEPELKNKKQAYEDSLNAARAALEDGIVPGGGVALLRASMAIGNLKLEGDEILGAKLVSSACEVSIRQIASNAGFDGSVILGEVMKAKPNFGFNALTEKVEDLLKAGVVDPAKVVKHAILYAASAAGIALISEALMTEAKEEDEADNE